MNQLGLNPNFTFITSYLEEADPKNQEIKLIDESVALANVNAYLNLQDQKASNPFSREIKYNGIDTLEKKKYCFNYHGKYECLKNETTW